MSPVQIRPLRPDDFAQWLPLWQGYQQFYKVSLSEAVTAQTWARFFEELVPMHGFVAEENGKLLGMVHYIYHYSTWTTGPYVYLQDLFTNEAARGKGIATRLIEAVYDQAAGAGASRVYWLTHESNDTAISLYRKVADQSGFIQFRKLMA
jgi:GNAT superfamily N-acetyltransferase